MSAATFDGLLLMAAVCGPILLLALIAEAWEVFRDDTE